MNAPTRHPGSHLHAISGCSSSGKSSLLAALAALEENVSPEPGRQIVKDELARGGDGLPWRNPQRFLDLCASKAIADFDRHVGQPRRTFFDRGFIDVAAGFMRSGLRAPAGLDEALQTRRYAPVVFMAAPWEALFHTDAERRHGFGEAVAEYEFLVPTYRRHGYEIVMLPQVPVPDRVSFVLASLEDRASGTSAPQP